MHETRPIGSLMSDISQDFRSADILGVPQAIKGFDKPDFYEVVSMNHKFSDIWFSGMISPLPQHAN